VVYSLQQNVLAIKKITENTIKSRNRMERTCKKCGEAKPKDDFPVNYIWCNSCAGFDSKYSIFNKNVLDISNYTGEGSVIITKYNNKVKDSGLDVARHINDTYPQYVYVLYCKETSYYKIGITNNFIIRYRSLCHSIGCQLVLKYMIALAPGRDEPNFFIEEFLKDYFINKKVKGEWFNLNKNNLNEIEDLFYHIFGDDIYTESAPYLIMDYSQSGSATGSTGRLKQIG
jgi:hypothetical protein